MADDGMIKAEDWLEEDLLADERVPDTVRPAGKKRSKKAKKDIFAEIKVRMVMRIYGASKSRALEIIAGRAGEKKALEAAKDKTGNNENTGTGRLMSAEEFFGL